MNPNQGISYISHSRGVPSLPMMLGGANQTGMHIPPTLDSLNDFPSLGDSTMNQFTSAQMAARTDYSGMVRDNGMAPVNQIEFNIQTEDFPALPGVAPGSSLPPSVPLDTGSSSVNPSSNALDDSVTGPGGDGPFLAQQAHLIQQQQAAQQAQQQSSHGEYSLGTPLLNACFKFASHPDFEKEVSLHYSSSASSSSSLSSTPASSTSSSASSTGNGDSSTTNKNNNSSTSSLFPKTLLKNPYGMLGLLQSIREKPFYGIDLTTLSTGPEAAEKSSLGAGTGGFSTSLFSDIKPRVFERETTVPDEYHIWNDVAPKMPKLSFLFSQFTEESLFVHFYLFSGSKYQRLASSELYARDWRFHKSDKVWIRRKSSPFEENNEFEHGIYIYFDFNTWKLAQKEMRIYYQSLEQDPRSEEGSGFAVSQ